MSTDTPGFLRRGGRYGAYRCPRPAAPGLGECVRSARLAKGLTIREVSTSVGRWRSWLGDVERGRAVKAPLLAQLAEVLGVELDEFRMPASVPRDVLHWPASSPIHVAMVRALMRRTTPTESTRQKNSNATGVVTSLPSGTR